MFPTSRNFQNCKLFSSRSLTIRDLSCILGLLPNSFKVSVSEPDRDGKQDYIIDQGNIEFPSSEEISKLIVAECSNKKLQMRQLAFHHALQKLIEENPSSSDRTTIEEYSIPIYPIEPIQSLQKKQKAKIVVSIYKVLSEKRISGKRNKSSSPRLIHPAKHCKLERKHVEFGKTNLSRSDKKKKCSMQSVKKGPLANRDWTARSCGTSPSRCGRTSRSGA